jgi:hypothetical protein
MIKTRRKLSGLVGKGITWPLPPPKRRAEVQRLKITARNKRMRKRCIRLANYLAEGFRLEVNWLCRSLPTAAKDYRRRQRGITT